MSGIAVTRAQDRLRNDDEYKQASDQLNAWLRQKPILLRQRGPTLLTVSHKTVERKIDALKKQVRHYELLKLSGRVLKRNRKLLVDQLTGVPLSLMGSRLVDLRIMLGLDLADLSSKTVIPVEMLERWERVEYRDCPVDFALKIAEGLVGYKVRFQLERL